MGYESRLYVINKSTTSTVVYNGELIYDIEDERYAKGKPMFWGEKIAMFNLCKVYDVVDAIKDYSATNAFIFADNGNDLIVEDLYGEPLTEIPLKDMIQILEKASKGDRYRRWNPCIQMLKGFNPYEWDNLVVLHYSY